VRDYVRLYSHLGGGKMEDFYCADPADAKRFAELARKTVEEGFTAFKTMAVPETMPLEGSQPIGYAEKCVAAMREAVGDSIDIMVDCHARASPRMGMLFAKALEPYNLYWLEEPCWPETMHDIALIQRAVKTPIATGERLVSVHPFRELLELRAASVIQPDITHCGGLSEARRICAMANAYRVAVAPHNPQGPVSTAASLELGFAEPSYIICEHVHADVPWRQDVVREGFIVDKKGQVVRPNTRPGLGIDINEEEVRKHPFQQEQLLRTFYKDGSVGDW
jgi:galactonate dehydratase